MGLMLSKLLCGLLGIPPHFRNTENADSTSPDKPEGSTNTSVDVETPPEKTPVLHPPVPIYMNDCSERPTTNVKSISTITEEENSEINVGNAKKSEVTSENCTSIDALGVVEETVRENGNENPSSVNVSIEKEESNEEIMKCEKSVEGIGDNFNHSKNEASEQSPCADDLNETGHNVINGDKNEAIKANESEAEAGGKEPDGIEETEEAKEDLSEKILDLQHHFADFDPNNLGVSKDSIEFLEKIKDRAKSYKKSVEQFVGTNYSVDYFVIDENLMRLMEALDSVKCHHDEKMFKKKLKTIKYIKDLQEKLDKQTVED